jgi:hypothetical protein
VGQAGVCQGTHGTCGDVVPEQVYLSSLPRSQSGKHLDELMLAIPSHSCYPENFPVLHREGNAA